MGEKKELVLPADKIAVIEEFFPGDGTYTINGDIRSAKVGYVVIDKILRKISVTHPHGKPFIPATGMLVLAVVNTVKEDIAFVDVIADKDGKLFSGKYSGVVHLSQASHTYIKNLEDAFKPGDIIIAKILSHRTPPLQLSTKHPSLGVVAAACSKCGELLVKKDSSTLVCPRCGNVEKRKLASNYMIRSR